MLARENANAAQMEDKNNFSEELNDDEFNQQEDEEEDGND